MSPLSVYGGTMLVNGGERPVVEQVGFMGTLDDPSDLEVEGAPWLLKSIFPRVIRNHTTDFFGPFQVVAGRQQIRFAFLRYHRIRKGGNTFAVQAGEVVTKRSPKKQTSTITWEPPHRVEGFPFCSLLSWKTGKELQYECVTLPLEPPGNLERQTKHIYIFSIDREDTTDRVLTRECPTAAPEDACTPWEGPLVFPSDLACQNRRPTQCADAATKPPATNALCREIGTTKEVQELADACEREIDDRQHVTYLLHTIPTAGGMKMYVGESSLVPGKPRARWQRAFVPTASFCSIDAWEPEVRLNFTCTNPAMAVGPSALPSHEYQLTFEDRTLTVRRCSGTPSAYVGKQRCGKRILVQ